MSHFEHVIRLQELDQQIEDAEREMRDILKQINVEKIESLNDIHDVKLRARYDRLQLKIKDLKRLKKGGYRTNSGRKCKYDGFETCVIRVPKFLREEVERFIEEKMAGYGYEKHLTDFEIKREAEKQEKKRLAEERSRAFWLRRNLDKQMNEDSSD
jgi:hypothetical protein